MIRKFEDRDEQSLLGMISRAFSVSIIESAAVQADLMAIYTSDDYWMKTASEFPLFVKEVNGCVVASGGHEGAEIKKIYVDPRMKGKGIGSEMLGFLESRVLKAGFSEAKLNAFPSSASFYEMRGYSIVGEEVFPMDNGPMPTKIMVKRLC